MKLALFSCKILEFEGIPWYFDVSEMKQMYKDNFKLPQVWAFEIYKILYLVVCFSVMYTVKIEIVVNFAG